MRVNEFKEQPYVNMFNQKIDVGDEVLYAASSWSYTSHRKGTYAGVYLNKNGKIVAVKVTHNLPGQPYEKYECSILVRKRIFKLEK